MHGPGKLQELCVESEPGLLRRQEIHLEADPIVFEHEIDHAAALGKFIEVTHRQDTSLGCRKDDGIDVPVFGWADIDDVTFRDLRNRPDTAHLEGATMHGFVAKGLFENRSERIASKNPDDDRGGLLLQHMRGPFDEAGEVVEEGSLYAEFDRLGADLGAGWRCHDKER